MLLWLRSSASIFLFSLSDLVLCLYILSKFLFIWLVTSFSSLLSSDYIISLANVYSFSLLPKSMIIFSCCLILCALVLNCPRFWNVFLRYYLSPAFQTFRLHAQLESHQACVYSLAKKFQFFLYILHPSQLCNTSFLMLLYPSLSGVGVSLLLYSISSWLPIRLVCIVFHPPCSSTARSQKSVSFSHSTSTSSSVFIALCTFWLACWLPNFSAKYYS